MFHITKGAILSLASSADVYARGEKYFKEDKVLSIQYESYDNGCQAVSAVVAGNFKNYNVQIVFSPSGEFKSSRCNCNAFEIWRGICKHIVAVLICISAKNSQFLARENQLRASRELNSIFEKQFYSEINSCGDFTADLANKKVTLNPTLFIETNSDSNVSLEFTIGRERQYIVKDLSDFMDKIRKGEVFKYGKNFSFRHAKEAFDDTSQRFISLIEWHDKLSHHFFKTNLPRFLIPLGRSFRLLPQKFDDFFDICENKTIPVVIGELEPIDAKFTRESPGIKFLLREDNGALCLDGVNHNFSYFQSEKYSYIIIDNNLHQTEKILGNTLTSLLKALRGSSAPTLYFEKDERRRFVSYTLPRLKKSGLLEIDSEDSLGLDIFDLKKNLYLDSEKGHIVCKALFNYGELEINPLESPPGKIFDNSPELVRDMAEEFRLVNTLLAMGFTEDSKHSVYSMDNDDDIFNLYLSGLDALKSLAEIFATDDFKRLFPPEKRKAQIGVRLSGNLLSMSVSSDFSLEELVEALASFTHEKKYHRLKNGMYINFEDDGLKAAQELLSSMDLTRRDIRGDEFILPKYRALALNRLAEEHPDAEFSKNEQFEKLLNDFKNFRDLEFKIPENLNDILRNYQKTGFNWLRMLSELGFGGILADDMGLGKTIQVIAALLSEKEKGGGTSLVVTPTSLIYNWEHEIKKFAPELSLTLITGAQQKRLEILDAAKSSDVLITTYDLLKRDIKSYDGINFKYIVADEAQYIKNPGTQNAKALKSVKGDVKFALTGTPMENSLSELWSIFDFVMPGYLQTHHKFVKSYETPIIKNNDTKRADELKKQTSPFILRRLKRDVLPELPDKVETTLYAEMEPEQRKLYTANLLLARGELDAAINGGEFGRSKLAILAAITRLRQICCHPALFNDSYTGGSGKLDLALDTIDSAIYSGHRILLFSQFTSMLAIFKARLKERNISYFYLDGATPAMRRLDMADKFNAGENHVFLISLKAGGTGLNLVGADVVMHYDPWWNPAVMNQATDRAHRIGQDNVVQIINFVAKESIEEKIIDLQSSKKDLAESIIVENASFLNKMSAEELTSLFQ